MEICILFLGFLDHNISTCFLRGWGVLGKNPLTLVEQSSPIMIQLVFLSIFPTAPHSYATMEFQLVIYCIFYNNQIYYISGSHCIFLQDNARYSVIKYRTSPFGLKVQLRCKTNSYELTCGSNFQWSNISNIIYVILYPILQLVHITKLKQLQPIQLFLL